MKQSEARYVETEDPLYLELHCHDGTYRGVIFKSAAAAVDALRAGRAELDCPAVLQGFLPRGATLVSRPGVHPPAFAGNSAALKLAELRVAHQPYVTTESDRAAREASPAASFSYDKLTARTPGSHFKLSLH